MPRRVTIEGQEVVCFETRTITAAKIIDTTVLVIAAAAGLFLGVAGIFFELKKLEGKELDIATAVLGAVALHGVLQRFTSHEIQSDLGSLTRKVDNLGSLDRARRGFVRSMGHFIDVQELKAKLRDGKAPRNNPAFGEVADRLLAPPFRILETLAEGQVSVPENLIAATFGMVLDSYKSRFDAVSNDDLGFWHDNRSIAPRYLSLNVSAMRRGVLVTRLFIFPEHQLLNERDREKIVEVLARQMSLGIAWAVAIYESLEPSLPAGPLDFALFDSDRALSTFRREGERRFVATFATDGLIRKNDERIADQRRLYDALLAEVWLATEKFAQQFLGSDNPATVAQLKSDTIIHNRRLQQIANQTADHEIFPLLVKAESEIGAKLDELAQVYQKYRVDANHQH